MIFTNHLGYCNVIAECRYFLQRLGNSTLKHTCRDQNRVVDALVRSGEGQACFDQVQILTVPPLFTVKILTTDKLGIAFPRKFTLQNVINLNNANSQVVLRVPPDLNHLSCNTAT